MNAKTLANRQLGKLPTYHNDIPLHQIFDIAKANGLEPVQEDGTSWEGIICGETGHAVFLLANTSSVLILDWYKMPSGRFEINTYIS